MPYDYVEDYEELTGKKPEPAPVETMSVETKVIEAPPQDDAKSSDAEVTTKDAE